MQASYHANDKAQYACNRQYLEATEPRCYGLAPGSWTIWSLNRCCAPSSRRRGVEPPGSRRHRAERERLEEHWRQRRQRARYDVGELAERRYQAVDPANRLVAATLERRWEEALGQERQLQEEYDRFVAGAGTAERRGAGPHPGVGHDIPALWDAPSTTNVDRKQMIRCLVERVVQVRCDSEFVDVTIHWAGGYESQHELVRPVATLRSAARLRAVAEPRGGAAGPDRRHRRSPTS